MKRGRTRPVEKNIVVWTGDATTTMTADVFYDAIFPGTLQGLRWEIKARQLSHLSNFAITEWAFIINRKGEDVSLIQLPSAPPAGSRELLTRGAEEQVIASGVLTTRFAEVATIEGIEQFIYKEDKTSGNVKTGRKLQVGDRLFLHIKSNALLGVQITCQATFFVIS